MLFSPFIYATKNWFPPAFRKRNQRISQFLWPLRNICHSGKWTHSQNLSFFDKIYFIKIVAEPQIIKEAYIFNIELPRLGCDWVGGDRTLEPRSEDQKNTQKTGINFLGSLLSAIWIPPQSHQFPCWHTLKFIVCYSYIVVNCSWLQKSSRNNIASPLATFPFCFFFFSFSASALIPYTHHISLYPQKPPLQILFKLAAASIIFWKIHFQRHQESPYCELSGFFSTAICLEP